MCTGALVLLVFSRFGDASVHRRVGFDGVFGFRSWFCAQARWFWMHFNTFVPLFFVPRSHFVHRRVGFTCFCYFLWAPNCFLWRLLPTPLKLVFCRPLFVYINMCFLMCKTTFQGLAPTGGLLGPMWVRCDAKARPFGSDFVHRRVGFNCFLRFWATFVHRRMSFMGVLAFWSCFYAQMGGFSLFFCVLEQLLCTGAWVLIKRVLAFPSWFCAQARWFWTFVNLCLHIWLSGKLFLCTGAWVLTVFTNYCEPRVRFCSPFPQSPPKQNKT